jgi:hypothetical protein
MQVDADVCMRECMFTEGSSPPTPSCILQKLRAPHPSHTHWTFLEAVHDLYKTLVARQGQVR